MPRKTKTSLIPATQLTPADQGIQAAKNDAMMIYRAELHTHHFHFEALGDTPKNAIAALVEGFKRHAREYRCKEDWFVEYVTDKDDGDGIVITEFALNGPGLRDREWIRN